MGLAHRLEPFGRGGVQCATCGAANESLLTWCPGFRLQGAEVVAVAEGRIIDLEKYRASRSWGHSKIYITEEAAEDEADARNLSPDEAMDAFMKYMDDTSIEDANASLGGDDA